LRSVALVVSSIANVPGPPRDSKRKYELLVQWFVANWAVVSPWISVVQLRDSAGRPIDRVREMVDRGIF
jgi:hypothetical protein